MIRGIFQAKDPTERIVLPFDFAKDLGGEAIGVATFAVTVENGTDATPGNVADGAATVLGGIVYCPVKGGNAGVDYIVTCTAPTNGGRTLVMAGTLPVRTA